MNSLIKPTSPSSSRILDIPCKVCGDFSSGKHYNIFACDGCAGFFKRSIRRNRQYVCKAKEEGTCVVNKLQRNQCRACRLAKCQEAGMNKDAVQHERGPRSSTLRRQQMATHLFSDPRETSVLLSSGAPVLDLPVQRQSTMSSVVSPPFPLIPPFLYNPSTLTNTLPSTVPIELSSLPSMNTSAATCELAARLLLMNVKWAQNIPSFTALPLPDQLFLLEESWRELFILGASQFLGPLDFSGLMRASGILEQSPDRRIIYLQEIKEFQETLAKLAQFQIDGQEFACLRAMVLFKTTFEKSTGSSSSATNNTSKTSRNLSNIAAVTFVQDQTQLTLNTYISSVHPEQPLRFGKLLIFLPTLRSVSAETIEELFFRKTIGLIPIQTIISNMYKSSKPDI
ncbi:nuclear hormone receptor [Holotrichia oblita]|uniref:Nuclear hormone receptor n=1 Tax=Holotrichia oblita TaxID=644536 RepID=A0ACB9SS65_HOLOL|nr:nuclear hormone receptor [Holotrichia oblita]